MKITKDKRVMWSLLLVAAYAVFIGFASYFTGWTGDDDLYAFNFASPGWNAPIKTLGDIIESQNVHYFIYNGRYAAHFLVQFFCGIAGHLPFAICNGLFYVFFILMLARLGRVSLSNVSGVSTVIVLTGITFQTKMTPSCQISYIWMYALSMLFIWLFLKRYKTHNVSMYVLLSIFSLICGNGQESLSVGIGGALIIYWFINMRRMTPAQYVMMISFGLGALACCLSPATLGRAASHEGMLLKFLPVVGYTLIDLVATFILIAVVVWHVLHKKEKFRVIYRNNEFFWNILFILLAFNFAIIITTKRQCFGFELMAIVLTLRLLNSHAFTFPWLLLSCIYFVAVSLVIANLGYKLWSVCQYMERQYCQSVDGRVYVDYSSDRFLGLAKLVVYDFEYSHSLSVGCKNLGSQSKSFMEINKNKHLHTLYPDGPDLTIVPTFLLGKDNVKLNDTIISLERGLHLFIQSKEKKSRFYVRRTPKIPFMSQDAIIEELSFEIPSYEGKHWRALVVYDGYFPYYNYTRQNFYIKKV